LPDELYREVLDRIKPSSAEEAHMRSVAREVIDKADSEAREQGLDVYAIHVGSTARDTWLKGKKDIDIFLMFPPDTPLEKLKEDGLRLAREVSPRFEERYAEHPYVTALYRGLDVDLVPCYRVKDASRIQSAVDRSPFHNEYVLKHIDALHDQVRLLKQFTRGVGVYGSELRTRGFSGYLCELLVLNYGSFKSAVEHGAGFKRGRVIDIEGHMDMSVEHPDPLIVIDPVDPRRNVAAALSCQKFCEFVDACRRFLKAPSADFFFPPPAEPMKKGALEGLLASRARGSSRLPSKRRTSSRTRSTPSSGRPRTRWQSCWSATSSRRTGPTSGPTTGAPSCSKCSYGSCLPSSATPGRPSTSGSTARSSSKNIPAHTSWDAATSWTYPAGTIPPSSSSTHS